MFEGATDVELLDVMRDAQRGERMAFARELLAAGRFTLQRIAASGQDYLEWCVDYWDVVAAEIAAELGISRGRASSWMDYGQTLIERLPVLGEVFAAGAVDFRVIRIVDFRTALITDEQALAAIDEMVAYKAPGWNALSDKKVAQLLDWMVLDVDPDAVRVAKECDDDRHFEVGPARNGVTEIYGLVRATDGAALNEKLAELAASVCRDDPRSTRQRRADTISALDGRGIDHGVPVRISAVPGRRQRGHHIECRDSRGGPGRHRQRRGDQTRLCARGRGDPAGDGARGGQDRPTQADRRSQRRAGRAAVPAVDRAGGVRALPGSDVPLDGLRQAGLAGRYRSHGAVSIWADAPVEQRLLLQVSPFDEDISRRARWLECDPAARRHHGVHHAVGQVHTTEPFGAMLFPQLAIPTGELQLPDQPPPGENRGLKMPKRKRTRAQDRAYRIQRERNINAARYAADPPPF